MKASFLITAALLSPLTQAYTGVEQKSLSADGIRSLTIRTYSGPLVITGSDGDSIEAEVVIDFDSDWEDSEARDALEEGLVFNLDGRGGRAQLESWVGDYDDKDFSFFTWGLIDLFRSGKNRPFSHLEVKVPRGIDLEINDYRGEVFISRVRGDIRLRTGAGPVEIADITGDLDLQDGSGEITLERISGDVEVRDGSGNIDITTIGGRLTIHDGSGNIDARDIGRFVDVRDGSGNIRLTDLKGDGEIYDGSGEIDVRTMAGTLSLTDGSGSIDLDDIGKDVIVHARGSGGFNVRNVRGEVIERGRDYNRNYRYRDNYRYDYHDRDRDIDIDEDVDVDIDEEVNRR